MRGLLRRASILLMGTLVVLSSLGCQVFRTTLNTTLTPDTVAFIIPGKTTLSDVIVKLGTPDSLTATEAGVVAIYRFLDAKYSWVNLGTLPSLLLPYGDVDFILSRTGLEVDAFEVLCDPQWVVLHQSFQRHLSTRLLHPIPF